MKDIPGIALKGKMGIDWSLFALINILLLINIPFFFNKVLPFGDGFSIFQHFYTAYNEFFLRGEFPLWHPFAAYGIQGDSDLIAALSPSAYFAGFLGLIFKIKNVYFLFKISLFLEQLVFLFGTYLLSGAVFRNKTTALFVCISVIGTLSLQHNIYFGLRIFYMLPLIIYFTIMFFSRYKPQYLIMAAIVFSLQGIGLNPYMIVFPLLVTAVIFITLSVGNYRNLRNFCTVTKKDVFHAVFTALFFILVAAGYLYFILHALDSIALVAPDREPGTGRVTLDSFLTYGGMTGIGKFIEFFFPYYKSTTLITGSNLSFFFGIAPLFFALYLAGSLIAKRKVSSLLVLSLLIVVAVLGLFSIGKKGLAAPLLYYIFPGMKYFRHIGSVVNAYTLFLPLLAGFGLEFFISANSSSGRTIKYRYPFVYLLFSGIVAISCIIYTIANLLSIRTLSSIIPNVRSYPQAVIIIFLGALSLFSINKLRKESVKTFIRKAALLVIGFEMLCLQLIVISSNYYMSKGVPLDREVISVNKYKFSNERMAVPYDERAFKSTILYMLQHPPLDASMLNFAQWDACKTVINAHDYGLQKVTDRQTWNMRTDLINKYVAILAANTTSNLDTFYGGSCASPKLRLMSSVYFTESLSGAVRQIKDFNIKNNLLLNNAPDDLVEEWRGEKFKTSDGIINVTDFKANGLELDVVLPEGGSAWLLYTDAWHPRWTAYVNDKPAYVAQADIAFKAVKLDGGLNRVSFVFDNRQSKYCMYVFSLAGISFMLMIITMSAYLLLFGGAVKQANP